MPLFPSSTRDIPQVKVVPRHIAIIMDGNGRWAKQRMLPRAAGHKRGVEIVREAVKACVSRGVEYLTLFAFSSENWRRPEEEVSMLKGLFIMALEREAAKLHRNGIRLRVVGDLAPFGNKITDLVERAEQLTHANDENDADHRGELRRALGSAAGNAAPGRVKAGAARRVYRRAARQLPCHGLRARARFVHPHRRGTAYQQLSAMAARLQRVLFHRHAVAGLRFGGAGSGDHVLSAARAALRPHQRATRVRGQAPPSKKELA